MTTSSFHSPVTARSLRCPIPDRLKLERSAGFSNFSQKCWSRGRVFITEPHGGHIRAHACLTSQINTNLFCRRARASFWRSCGSTVALQSGVGSDIQGVFRDSDTCMASPVKTLGGSLVFLFPFGAFGRLLTGSSLSDRFSGGSDYPTSSFAASLDRYHVSP